MYNTSKIVFNIAQTSNFIQRDIFLFFYSKPICRRTKSKPLVFNPSKTDAVKLMSSDGQKSYENRVRIFLFSLEIFFFLIHFFIYLFFLILWRYPVVLSTNLFLYSGQVGSDAEQDVLVAGYRFVFVNNDYDAIASFLETRSSTTAIAHQRVSTTTVWRPKSIDPEGTYSSRFPNFRPIVCMHKVINIKVFFFGKQHNGPEDECDDNRYRTKLLRITDGF